MYAVYLLSFIVGVLGSLNGMQLFSTSAPVAGATLPQTVAVFETSLQSPITSSATSMTLAANSVRGGGTLSGYNCFTIDEGSAQAEYVCGTVASTAITGMSRGVSPSTGTSTIASLQFAHRRGANVKITDFPSIQIMKAMLNGEETIPNGLTYANTVCTGSSANAAICDKAYIDGVAVAGASNANETTKGIVELSTTAEAAAGTSAGGTSARLAIPASMCNATWSAATLCVITSAGGKIAQGFWDLTASFTFSGGLWSSASTTIAASNASTTALTLNGVPYRYPALNGATSTVLTEDGVGRLSWMLPTTRTIYVTNVQNGTTVGATTTLATAVIPASALTNGNSLKISATYHSDASAGYCYPTILVGNGTSSTTVALVAKSNSAVSPMTLEGKIITNGNANATSTFMGIAYGATGVTTLSQNVFGNPGTQYFLYANPNYTFSAQTYIQFAATAIGPTCYLSEADVQIVTNP